MIRHMVMWKLRGETAAEQQAARQMVKAAFEGLLGRVPGLLSMEVGSDESGVDYACDVVMIAYFIDAQALTAYATHYDHLRVRHELGDLRTLRYQVDYPSAERPPINDSMKAARHETDPHPLLPGSARHRSHRQRLFAQ
ncbi:Dabb family protein [Pseudomonas sp. 13B_2.1_Bac1]|uniref:Dabb family protein n=1 Tax=Pseudomonas sp. 13B_2.1_Bac1 TaxID=2971624 RepID=UPI0021C6ED46|nr:Dabb family protein [Pseudomonas sp. 13B_2.1_Bac1]MCU1785192.1 Dabb family protein [Pseudomonas sp. 13B_2.1_Bac1]